jgi:predicted transcriptional regulator
MSGVEKNIFSDLANPVRLDVLNYLLQGPMKVSRLSESMDMTIQALQRHIDRLLKSDMIIQNNGHLCISSVGTAVLEQIPTFAFLSKFRDHFRDHTFDGIPRHLVARLGELNDCELIDDPIKTWQQAKRLVEGTGTFLYGITSVLVPEFYETTQPLLRKKAKFKIIMPHNMIVAKTFGQSREKFGWIDQMKKGHVEERYVKNAPFMVMITDKEAQLMFANKKTGQIDSNHMFYSKDDGFRNWCLALFDHYWNEIEKIDLLCLQEV